MKIIKYKFLVIIFLFNFLLLKAQVKLSLEEAIEIGLKNNYEINIERNNATINKNNNTIGNAQMLPKVDLAGTTNLANNTTKQEFANGLKVDENNVESNNLTAGVYLTWTLFDGLKMFATKKKLNELETIGSINSKIKIENTVSEIIVNYYNIVRQKQLIKGLTENLSISEERLKIAGKKLEIGSGSKLEVLQAKVDMNAQTSNLLKQKTILSEIKISLNKILAISVETYFDVTESIPKEFQLNFEELKNSIEKKNTSVLLAERNIEFLHDELNEYKSQLLPKLNFNSSYLFSRNENQAGFALLNQNLGLNLGLTASWTIFNGLQSRAAIKNAHLNLDNSNLQFKNTKIIIDSQLTRTFNNYVTEIEILSIEEMNSKFALEALNIAIERFRLGLSNSLELKDIQRSYEDALIRLTDSQFSVKVLETELMKLNGGLIK